MERQVETKQGRGIDHASTAYAYTGGKPFDATLPCVVFIHGALHDHSVWTLLARWFAHHGHSVLAVDLPGHGRSEGPPLESVEALADWTLALLNAVGVKQAALVGHSMGSLIALEAAGRAPGRITRLAMLGTAYPMKVSDALLSTARENPLKAIDMVNAFSISTTSAKPSYPGPCMRRISARLLPCSHMPGPGYEGLAAVVEIENALTMSMALSGLSRAVLSSASDTFIG